MSLKITKSPFITISDDFSGYALESFNINPHLAKNLDRVLIPGGFIQDRIERLACDIAIDLANESFVALCVLKGGYVFFNDLLDKIRHFYRYRYADPSQPYNGTDFAQQIRVEFIRLKSYEDDKSTSNLKVIGIESLESLRGKNVLIVEDIIDTGNTMVKLRELLKEYDLKSIRVTSLFVKRTPLSNGYTPDYVGFNIPNKFIVGCNMDYNEYFRELNHVCVMSKLGKEEYSMKSSE
ncbi:unnamed protein product [Medioppia subpectinata]|uniref:Hypoxanthine phosphoribosyltransferase n=2 Tax=Medioppia subpectinata TaxID=1979941 RepID=A0A7R9KSQ9_9ACAR|nr:unnamed protein product [Medioppia subpectinata]CAG2108833.1 unnamed protein product [Medioppia subpectinata]